MDVLFVNLETNKLKIFTDCILNKIIMNVLRQQY